MKTALVRQARWGLGALAIGAALAACGGGDGGSNTTSAGTGSGGSGSTGGSGNGGAVTPVTPAAVTYMGVVSFGDTVAITLDAPGAGKLKIRFADSAFGLSGTLIGDYALNAGVYTVSNLVVDSADPPPAFVSAVLSTITATFTVSGTTLTGEIGGLPKQLGGGKLSGHVTASSVSTAASAASLAGTYTFLRTQSTYYASSGNLQTQAAMGGQMRVNADGTVRMCQTETYSDTCSAFPALLGTLALADQTRYPGAYQLTLGGKLWGRVFPLLDNGVPTLYLDHNTADTQGNPMTGTGVFHPGQSLTAGQFAGSWTCSEPGAAYAAVSGLGIRAALDGSIVTETLTIDTNGVVTSAKHGTSTPLLPNLTNNLLGIGYSAASMVPGTMTAIWTLPAPSTDTRTQVFLPVNANTMAYYAEIKSTASDPVPWTFVVQGTCRKG